PRYRLPEHRLEDVDGLRDHPAPAEVRGLRLRVPMADVALLVLEVPDPHDEEVPLANPHPLLQLPRDPAQAGLAVRTHHANAGCSEKLVRDPIDLLLAVRGESDTDDLFLGHGERILQNPIRVSGLLGPGLRADVSTPKRAF